jgi:hypothetical protein
MNKYVDYGIEYILEQIQDISKTVLDISEKTISNFGTNDNTDLYNLSVLRLYIEKLNDLSSRHEYTDYVCSKIIQPEDK